MQRTLKSLALTVVLALAATPALALVNINVVGGQRFVDTGHDELDDVEDQFFGGANVQLTFPAIPVSFYGGFYASSKTEDNVDIGNGFEADITLSFAEAYVGVGKTFQLGIVRPFVHGGVTSIGSKLELDRDGASTLDDESRSLGAYVEGGVFFRIGAGFNIGADVRVVRFASFDFSPGDDYDGDYVQGGVLLGWGFGK